jgi:hypothetical protein
MQLFTITTDLAGAWATRPPPLSALAASPGPRIRHWRAPFQPFWCARRNLDPAIAAPFPYRPGGVLWRLRDDGHRCSGRFVIPRHRDAVVRARVRSMGRLLAPGGCAARGSVVVAGGRPHCSRARPNCVSLAPASAKTCLSWPSYDSDAARWNCTPVTIRSAPPGSSGYQCGRGPRNGHLRPSPVPQSSTNLET